MTSRTVARVLQGMHLATAARPRKSGVKTRAQLEGAADAGSVAAKRSNRRERSAHPTLARKHSNLCPHSPESTGRVGRHHLQARVHAGNDVDESRKRSCSVRTLDVRWCCQCCENPARRLKLERERAQGADLVSIRAAGSSSKVLLACSIGLFAAAVCHFEKRAGFVGGSRKPTHPPFRQRNVSASNH